MDTPAPIDLNKLKGILGNARKVMAKVENKDFTTGHIDARALTQESVEELQSEGGKPTSIATQPMGDYTDEQVMNSKLPPAIKKAMMEKKIAKPVMPNHTFTLDDVSDITQEKPMGLPKTPVTKRTLQEGVANNSDLITISKSQLDEMINARLLEFFTKAYNKTITEETIKKTINVLIKEGKLSVKKKSI